MEYQLGLTWSAQRARENETCSRLPCPCAQLSCTTVLGATRGPANRVARTSLGKIEARATRCSALQFYHGLSSLTKLGWCNIQLVPPDTNPLLMLTQHEVGRV